MPDPDAPSDSPSWIKANLGYLVAALVGFLVCMPAVAGLPIWDDEIVLERFLPSFRSVGDAFFPPADVGELGEKYYRPFVTLSYMLDDALFGRDSFVGHHLQSFGYHALACFWLGQLVTRLLRAGGSGGLLAQRSGWAAAVLFAVHPVHVESVAQITGRCDPMAAAFALAALLFVLRGRDLPDRWWPWLAAGAAFLAGLFSKEVAGVVLLPAAGMLWLLRASRQAWLRFGVTFGVTALIYFVLRAQAGLAGAGLREQAFGEAVTGVLRALAFDLQMLLLPIGQAAFVPFETTPGVAFGALALLALVGLGWLAWRGRHAHPLHAVGYCWFLATLAPVLALVVVQASEQLVAERFLYVPSVALAMSVGWGVAVLAERFTARVVWLAFLVVVTAAGAATAWRSAVYSDPLTFWRDTVAKAPGVALPTYQLGMTLRKRGELEEAMPLLVQALERYEDAEGRGLAHNTIATIHLERREWAAAERHLQQAVRERPGYAVAWFNLAGVYSMRAGRPDLADSRAAVDALERAVALRPGYDKARVQMARQYYGLMVLERQAGRRAASEELRARAVAAARWLASRPTTNKAGQDLLQRLERLR
ncbi:MAG: hypothetical protein NXI31_16815 [bacterium]|nr:hypothetical protein [bacterium]